MKCRECVARGDDRLDEAWENVDCIENLCPGYAVSTMCRVRDPGGRVTNYCPHRMDPHTFKFKLTTGGLAHRQILLVAAHTFVRTGCAGKVRVGWLDGNRLNDHVSNLCYIPATAAAVPTCTS